ncbi:MAG: SPOR domain-containing protein [Flavobacteriales bacterium]|nr:SPOR domain-containing protein [Flavobacteriales bacterium]MBL6877415.1 SPOR domain-containing protein [Flavobacteriaceae bacterium]
MNKIITYLSIFFLCANSFSQSQLAQVNQDSRIDSLLKLKKEINKNTFDLKIQIFSGERDKALELIANHDKDDYSNTNIELVYETPNYKVWIGDFYSQLEADKKLLMIKKKYPEAFIFRPKPKIENTNADLVEIKQ